MLKKSSNPFWSLLLLMSLLGASPVFGQGTSFTYQGKLTDGTSPASGTYDMQFKLFDMPEGGTQQGTDVTNPTVLVSGGIFTVQLDFGSGVFNGSPRFLEIAVRPAGNNDPHTVLSPRQPVTQTPYAIRSASAATADYALNASQLEGLPSSGFIQNGTSQQTGTNFNIGGDGNVGGLLTASTVRADFQFNIGAQRILSAPGGGTNIFAGVYAGATNTTGIYNSFFGPAAGYANTNGSYNSFFGPAAGRANTTGSNNSFLGSSAGFANTNGSYNSFFGSSAGYANTIGNYNSFLGRNAGFNNTEGGGNVFLGLEAGFSNTTGADNAFLGTFAGWSNTSGNYNTFIGRGSKGAAGDLTNATAVGANALVNCSNCMVLGSINGLNGATSGVKVGIGTTNPQYQLDVDGGAGVALRGLSTNTTGVQGVSTSGSAIVGQSISGIGVLGFSENNFGVFGTSPSGTGVRGVGGTGWAGEFIGKVSITGLLRLPTLGAPGLLPLCVNIDLDVSFCSSSLRYKTDVGPFSGGLDTLNRLRPIAFTWKQGGMRDLGLAAEEVEKVEPLLVTYNEAGQVEGVKYDRLNVVLVNAMQQQQRAIESLRHENAELKARFAALEQVVQQIKDQQAMILKASR